MVIAGRQITGGRKVNNWSVVEYAVWKHVSGKRASIHGAVPYLSAADKTNWEVVKDGFTLYNSHSNTYGCGRPPCKTREEAQALADKFNSQ